MEQIQHTYVEVSGLKLHVAELGTGEEQTLCFETIWSYFNFVSIPLKEVPVQVLRRCCSCMASLKYGIHGGTKWLPLQPLDTEQLPLILGAMGSPNSLLSLRRRLLTILWLMSLELWTVWASVRYYIISHQ